MRALPGAGRDGRGSGTSVIAGSTASTTRTRTARRWPNGSASRPPLTSAPSSATPRFRGREWRGALSHGRIQHHDRPQGSHPRRAGPGAADHRRLRALRRRPGDGRRVGESLAERAGVAAVDEPVLAERHHQAAVSRTVGATDCRL